MKPWLFFLVSSLVALRLEASEPSLHVYRYLESGETEHLAVRCHTGMAAEAVMKCVLTLDRQGNVITQTPFPTSLFTKLLTEFKAERKLASTATTNPSGRDVLGWVVIDGKTEQRGLVTSRTPYSQSRPAYELDSALGSYFYEARLQKSRAGK
jgi:hypothetical protein